MALVGKAAGRRDRGRRLSARQHGAGAQQADLDEIGVRRGAIGRAEDARELVAVSGAGRPGKRIGADIVGDLVMKPLPRPPGHARIASGRGGVDPGDLEDGVATAPVRRPAPRRAPIVRRGPGGRRRLGGWPRRATCRRTGWLRLGAGRRPARQRGWSEARLAVDTTCYRQSRPRRWPARHASLPVRSG